LQIHLLLCMLICMKPTSKQLSDLQGEIVDAYSAKGLSKAEIGRRSKVHPSQVSRICSGNFKTLSQSVVQICMTLDVSVPRPEPMADELDPDWARVQSSMRKIWDETPEGAKTIARMLDAIAELQGARQNKASKAS